MDQRFIERVYEGFEYERSSKRPPADFPALPPIPGGRYTDPGFLELEQQFLWKKSRLYACHSDEIPRQGSYILLNKTGSPILIVRGENGRVKRWATGFLSMKTRRQSHFCNPLAHLPARCSNFNRILQEDIDLVTKIQHSTESPGFEGIRLNYQERRIYHWHEELDRRIGIERIPEHLRVEPRMSGMIER